MALPESDTPKTPQVLSKSLQELKMSTPYPTGPSLIRRLSTVLFTHLAKKANGEVREALEKKGVIDLKVDEEVLILDGQGCWNWLLLGYLEAYDDDHWSSFSLFRSVLDDALPELQSILSEAAQNLPQDEVVNHLKTVFEQPYIGNAHLQLSEVLDNCCRAYAKTHIAELFKPYVSVIQSSGFGKSRLMFELAKHVSIRDVLPEESAGVSVDMRLLYVSARSILSPGHPAATGSLKRWLLCSGLSIADKLDIIYKYAQQHWDSVGEEWLDLFTGEENKVLENLKKPQKENRNKMAPNQGLENTHRTLVLAIDDSRSLFVEDETGVSLFQKLIIAVKTVNYHLRRRGYLGGVFALFVDSRVQLGTNAHIYSYSKHPANTKIITFPPFVLTQGMDVMCSEKTKSLLMLKETVCDDDPVESWDNLVRMGRPLWSSFFRSLICEVTTDEAKARVIGLAASKLLLGRAIDKADSYSGETMHGVAALLCRIGVRPRAHSPLAPRLVADFMAVLQFVNHTHDAYLCGFPSEPVLALGAARVWYQLDPPAIEQHLLPEFGKLVTSGVLDIGNLHNVVVRIFLLLAVDAASLKVSAIGDVAFADYILDGTFCPVHAFLQLLLGAHEVIDQDMDVVVSPVNDLNACMSVWENWKLSYTQFVELRAAPSEKTLWWLLSRRAAGIVHRGQEETHLLLPMFCGDAVSFVLVRVVKELLGLPPQNVLRSTKEIFDGDRALVSMLPRPLIQIVITVYNSYLCAPTQCVVVGESESTSHALILRGICDQAEGTSHWSFLSAAASSLLSCIARTRWRSMVNQAKSELQPQAEDLRSVLSLVPSHARPARALLLAQPETV